MRRFTDQPIPFPAARDYGPRGRWPTLAVVWHMAEGKNVAQYLSRDPLRGVSVHYTIEQATDRWQDGQVVRCRVEVAGIAKEGPTEAQQRSMVALWDELKSRYPKVIQLGHRDWQAVKPCPGKTTAMRAAFSAMGGHGTEYSEVRYMSTRDYASGKVCTVRDGSKLYDHPGGLAIGMVDPPLARDYLDPSDDSALISSELGGKSRTAWVSAKGVSKNRPAPAPDCADAVTAEHERVKAAALAAIEGI